MKSDPWLEEIRVQASKAIKSVALKGGAGSGNFGHAGRPGEIGGSTADNSSEEVGDEKRDRSKGHGSTVRVRHGYYRGQNIKWQGDGVYYFSNDNDAYVKIHDDAEMEKIAAVRNVQQLTFNEIRLAKKGESG